MWLCTACATTGSKFGACFTHRRIELRHGWFANQENFEGDELHVGILLRRNKDELLVEYSTYGMNSQLFVQKYQLYLPDREALKAEIERTLAEVGQ